MKKAGSNSCDMYIQSFDSLVLSLGWKRQNQNSIGFQLPKSFFIIYGAIKIMLFNYIFNSFHLFNNNAKIITGYHSLSRNLFTEDYLCMNPKLFLMVKVFHKCRNLDSLYYLTLTYLPQNRYI